MNFALLPVEDADIPAFKAAMQEAFQLGYEAYFGSVEDTILPERDIDQSLYAPGAVAYKAMVDGEMAGGAVVVINESTRRNHLDLLYVKHGTQSRGVGRQIWFAIEALHPATEVWETCTPCFEQRNIHFYVHVCGFHIAEVFDSKHPMPDAPENFVGDGGGGMVSFEKHMH